MDSDLIHSSNVNNVAKSGPCINDNGNFFYTRAIENIYNQLKLVKKTDVIGLLNTFHNILHLTSNDNNNHNNHNNSNNPIKNNINNSTTVEEDNPRLSSTSTLISDLIRSPNTNRDLTQSTSSLSYSVSSSSHHPLPPSNLSIVELEGSYGSDAEEASMEDEEQLLIIQNLDEQNGHNDNTSFRTESESSCKRRKTSTNRKQQTQINPNLFANSNATNTINTTPESVQSAIAALELLFNIVEEQHSIFLNSQATQSNLYPSKLTTVDSLNTTAVKHSNVTTHEFHKLETMEEKCLDSMIDDSSTNTISNTVAVMPVTIPPTTENPPTILASPSSIINRSITNNNNNTTTNNINLLNNNINPSTSQSDRSHSSNTTPSSQTRSTQLMTGSIASAPTTLSVIMNKANESGLQQTQTQTLGSLQPNSQHHQLTELQQQHAVNALLNSTLGQNNMDNSMNFNTNSSMSSSSRRRNRIRNPSLLLESNTKRPFKTLNVRIQKQFTMSKKDIAEMTAAGQITHSQLEQLVTVRLRIMGSPTRHQMLFLSSDICMLIHRQKDLVRNFSPSEKARVRMMAKRPDGTDYTIIVSVLSVEGVKKLLMNSRSAIANQAWHWLDLQISQIAGGTHHQTIDNVPTILPNQIINGAELLNSNNPQVAAFAAVQQQSQLAQLTALQSQQNVNAEFLSSLTGLNSFNSNNNTSGSPPLFSALQAQLALNNPLINNNNRFQQLNTNANQSNMLMRNLISAPSNTNLVNNNVMTPYNLNNFNTGNNNSNNANHNLLQSLLLQTANANALNNTNNTNHNNNNQLSSSNNNSGNNTNYASMLTALLTNSNKSLNPSALSAFGSIKP